MSRLCYGRLSVILTLLIGEAYIFEAMDGEIRVEEPWVNLK